MKLILTIFWNSSSANSRCLNFYLHKNSSALKHPNSPKFSKPCPLLHQKLSLSHPPYSSQPPPPQHCRLEIALSFQQLPSDALERDREPTGNHAELNGRQYCCRHHQH
nr:hypothetical protein Iba_chr03aCG17670 [Ipomoea batatas]